MVFTCPALPTSTCTATACSSFLNSFPPCEGHNRSLPRGHHLWNINVFADFPAWCSHISYFSSLSRAGLCYSCAAYPAVNSIKLFTSSHVLGWVTIHSALFSSPLSCTLSYATFHLTLPLILQEQSPFPSNLLIFHKVSTGCAPYCVLSPIPPALGVHLWRKPSTCSI